MMNMPWRMGVAMLFMTDLLRKIGMPCRASAGMLAGTIRAGCDGEVCKRFRRQSDLILPHPRAPCQKISETFRPQLAFTSTTTKPQRLRRAPAAPGFRPRPRLGQRLVRQCLGPAMVDERQTPMIEAQLVQDRGVQIGHADAPVSGAISHFVASSRGRNRF